MKNIRFILVTGVLLVVGGLSAYLLHSRTSPDQKIPETKVSTSLTTAITTPVSTCRWVRPQEVAFPEFRTKIVVERPTVKDEYGTQFYGDVFLVLPDNTRKPVFVGSTPDEPSAYAIFDGTDTETIGTATPCTFNFTQDHTRGRYFPIIEWYSESESRQQVIQYVDAQMGEMCYKDSCIFVRAFRGKKK